MASRSDHQARRTLKGGKRRKARRNTRKREIHASAEEPHSQKETLIHK